MRHIRRTLRVGDREGAFFPRHEDELGVFVEFEDAAFEDIDDGLFGLLFDLGGGGDGVPPEPLVDPVEVVHGIRLEEDVGAGHRTLYSTEDRGAGI